MQLIYEGKTERSTPRYNFPNNFSQSANPKHFSNTNKSLKLIDEIIVPHIQFERTKLQLQIDHPALLIIDVFSEQMAPAVLQKLRENYIFLVRVPPNMTNLFQPLDLTVNSVAKAFMKRRFTEWCSQEIWKELESGKELSDIDIKLTLTILKPLHASWLTDLYDYLTSQKGAEIIFNGQQSSGITEAIVKGTKDLKNRDPFVSVYYLEHDDTIECLQDYKSLQASEESIANFVTQKEVLAAEESDDEWEYDGATNIFEKLDNEIKSDE